MKKKMLLPIDSHTKIPLFADNFAGFSGVFPGIVVALYHKESLMRKELKRQWKKSFRKLAGITSQLDKKVLGKTQLSA